MRKLLLGLGVAALLAVAGTTTNPTPSQALGWHHGPQWGWWWHYKPVEKAKPKKAKKAKKAKKKAAKKKK